LTRFLIIGAGALGGYFGGRLLEVGQDVTFLLRERRARQIEETGLVIHSPFGDLTWPHPQHVSRETLSEPYDVIIVGCKAYDLADTMDAFAPAVGEHTLILPVLNGMAHIEALTARFGADKVLGGFCLISAALDEHGHVRHYNDSHKLVFGPVDGVMSARIDAIVQAFSGARCDAIASDQIIDEMWGKWVQIATAAGMTCLMRASIGDIVTAGGTRFAHALLNEAAHIAAANGHPLSDEVMHRIRTTVSDPASPVTASMMKDIERGASVEADHLIGNLLARRASPLPDAALPLSLLDIVYLHLRSYMTRKSAA
jgi:2-dehydropantoate 2-reductase